MKGAAMLGAIQPLAGSSEKIICVMPPELPAGSGRL